MNKKCLTKKIILMTTCNLFSSVKFLIRHSFKHGQVTTSNTIDSILSAICCKPGKCFSNRLNSHHNLTNDSDKCYRFAYSSKEAHHFGKNLRLMKQSNNGGRQEEMRWSYRGQWPRRLVLVLLQTHLIFGRLAVDRVVKVQRAHRLADETSQQYDTDLVQPYSATGNATLHDEFTQTTHHY